MNNIIKLNSDDIILIENNNLDNIIKVSPIIYDNNIELVLTTNHDTQIAIPINSEISPEILAGNGNCELYKYCIIIPFLILVIILLCIYMI